MKQKLLLIGIGIVIFSGLIVYYLSNDFPATLVINLIITFPVLLIVFSLWYELWKDRIIDRWEKDPNKEKYTYLVESNKIDSGRVHFTIKVDLNGYLWRCYSKRVDWKKNSTIENLRETVMKEFLEEKREEAEELIKMTSTTVYKFQNKNEEEKKSI